MKITLFDHNGALLCESVPSGSGCTLVYKSAYNEGDYVVIQTPKNDIYDLQLDEVIGRHPVYMKKEARYEIPVLPKSRTCYHPYAFQGELHTMSVGIANLPTRRNLAMNPYDHHTTDGLLPHAKANVETRGEMDFAARNAIDGVFANHDHGPYPFASWGINRDPEALFSLDFGRNVVIDEIRITVRGDWPHDSWWTEATVTDSNNIEYVLTLKKDPLPQVFPIKPTEMKSLTLGKLIKADDPSPFPALTQFEAWGVEVDP